MVTRHTAGAATAVPPVIQLPLAAGASAALVEVGPTLRVATLNMAHGRADGFHQFIQGSARIRANLDAIATLMVGQAPAVLAVQEADAASVWSGNFDHVRYLAEAAGLPWFSHGSHVKGMRLSYGAALLANAPMTAPLSVTFAPSPPTFAKGFLVATITPPGWSVGAVDVVSVHLDFARPAVRRRQVDALLRHLRERSNPLVIMGDFNCQWQPASSPLRRLARSLDLRAWQPESEDLVTFATTGRRLDWILVSPELRIVDQRILDDVVSDHRAVIADIAPAGGAH